MAMELEEFLKEWRTSQPCVLVHTSGSTGKPKPLLVEKRRMEASARKTCRFLHLQSGMTALLALPLDYIAGKMMVVRSEVCGLRLIAIEPSGNPLRAVKEHIDFAAFTPMQVYNMLQDKEQRERLKLIGSVIIGGGGISEAMERELADFPNAIYSTYGMTETLSHIALRRLNGEPRSPYYMPLEGVSVGLNADSCLVISAPDVAKDVLETHDIAEFSPDKSGFRILGRLDNVISTGGIKVLAEEIEQRLRGHIPTPFFITKRKDEKFGEAITLVYERAKDTGKETSIKKMREICASLLPKYHIPRYYLKVEHLPLTETGKPKRRLSALCEASCVTCESDP